MKQLQEWARVQGLWPSNRRIKSLKNVEVLLSQTRGGSWRGSQKSHLFTYIYLSRLITAMQEGKRHIFKFSEMVYFW